MLNENYQLEFHLDEKWGGEKDGEENANSREKKCLKILHLHIQHLHETLLR